MSHARRAQLLKALDGLVDTAVQLRQRTAHDLLVTAPTAVDVNAALDLAAALEDEARSVATLLSEIPTVGPRRRVG